MWVTKCALRIQWLICFGINIISFNISKDFKTRVALSLKQGLEWHTQLLAVLAWFPQKSGNFPVVLLLMENFPLIWVKGLYLTCASSATHQKISDKKHYERHSVSPNISHNSLSNGKNGTADGFWMAHLRVAEDVHCTVNIYCLTPRLSVTDKRFCIH